MHPGDKTSTSHRVCGQIPKASRDSNPAPFVREVDALQLHHRFPQERLKVKDNVCTECVLVASFPVKFDEDVICM